MKALKEKLKNTNRLGLFVIMIFLFWAKTMMAYYVEFELGVTGSIQTFILWINPFATSVILLSVGLYIKDWKKSRYVLLFIYFLVSILLFTNVLYYREFADFMTLSTITGNMGFEGGSNLSVGLIVSFMALLKIWDVLYWIDFIFLIWLTREKKDTIQSTEKIKRAPFYKRYAVATSLVGIALLFGNLMIAEMDRPQLLTRTFDRNYIVKYLGINFYTGYDATLNIRNSRIRAQADEGDLNEVYEFAKENYASPNEEFFGIAEGRNVITLVFESAQQFVMDYHLEDENGVMHEVTPFMNEIYHDDSTISFNNFFHQTGQGKSSDAEVLAENSLFGLSEGSAFQTLGSENVFHATPKILEEEKGYSSAAFHGNTGSFWNRTGTYRNFGYDYFFDSNYYDMSDDRTLDYGLKDKLFFRDSTEYIEQLPQPFYSKFITLTNHFPYPLEEENASIPKANTEDDTVNSYFQTMRYTDEAFEEFFNWLKETGLYDNSMIVIYGDHYGTSNMRNPHLGELLGHDPDEWGEYENAQMQRVPLMFHIPGYTEGKTHETYGGQVDFLPTLLHLLGVQTDSYLFMGQDLLSPENEETVPLRNGTVLTPSVHFIGSNMYDAETGEDISEVVTETERTELIEAASAVRNELTQSDNLLRLDLLRFYQPVSLKSWEPNDYQYLDQMNILNSHPERDTNLVNQLGVETTMDLYQTNAPELIEEEAVEEVEEPEPIETNKNEILED